MMRGGTSPIVACGFTACAVACATAFVTGTGSAISMQLFQEISMNRVFRTNFVIIVGNEHFFAEWEKIRGEFAGDNDALADGGGDQLPGGTMPGAVRHGDHVEGGRADRHDAELAWITSQQLSDTVRHIWHNQKNSKNIKGMKKEIKTIKNKKLKTEKNKKTKQNPKLKIK
jgi:hypothetical protein